jgi:hypothetical protein
LGQLFLSIGHEQLGDRAGPAGLIDKAGRPRTGPVRMAGKATLLPVAAEVIEVARAGDL